MGGKRPGQATARVWRALAVLAEEGAGVVPRRRPAKLRVRTRFVVVAPPGFEHGAGVRQRAEQRLVQQFVAQAAVEATNRPSPRHLALRSEHRIGRGPLPAR